ncbi:MAG: DUF1259 domain-containing protein [Gemmatimonadota bacterium]|nr:DUF1259 domain-containing protein [Gemmatimonadota bacterium]
MNKWRLIWILAGFVLQAACSATSPPPAVSQRSTPQMAAASGIDWKTVDAALERSGSMQPGGVYKFSMPRADLAVISDGVRIAPALALGSWLAFQPKGEDAAVAMGDLVLTEGEYQRVIARLQEGGVRQTAIHKHLLDESPAIWWTHVEAEGDPVRIAGAVRAALALTGTPADDPSPGAPAPFSLDTAAISGILGYSGSVSGGVYHVSVPRADTIRARGVVIPPAMGTANALNFQPTGNGRAAINGDFVMLADEVNPVIAALKQNGIEVVSMHNHMLTEEPRLFFMHFWANGDALDLARGLRAAIDRVNVAGVGER